MTDLPKDTRRWWYFPIYIPLTKDGDGPCTIQEAESVAYEVWDRDCNTVSTHSNLYCAINEAMKLNEEKCKLTTIKGEDWLVPKEDDRFD